MVTDETADVKGQVGLICPGCGRAYEIGPVFGCPGCGGGLEVVYSDVPRAGARDGGEAVPSSRSSLGRRTVGGDGVAAAMTSGPGARGPRDPGIWRWRGA